MNLFTNFFEEIEEGEEEKQTIPPKAYHSY